MNVTVTVGLGTGNKDQQLGHLMTVLQIQQQAIARQGGADGPLVTLGNIYNTVKRICENAGLKTADPYFTDPKTPPTHGPGGASPQPGGAVSPGPPPQAGPQPGVPGGAPPPDPHLIALQAKMQVDQQRAAQEVAIERMKAGIDQQTKLAIAQIQAATDIQIAKIGKGMVEPTPPIPPPEMPAG
jgi:hypothetical protein